LARQAVEEFEKEKIVDLEASAREMLARALFAQGKLAEAQKEIETAGKLSPQDRTIRLSIAITAAKLNARAGKVTEARHALEAAFAEASRLKLTGFQLEIRLAQAETESASDPVPAQEHLKFLESEARNAGYLLVAGKAAHLRQTKFEQSRK